MRNRITDPAKLDAYRKQYVANYTQTAQMIRAKRGEAVAWTWTDDKGNPRAVAWFGRSMNPYSGNSGPGGAYRFRTEASRRAWIADLIERAAAHAERTTKRKQETAAARAAGHKLVVGSVLRCTWGYDQTNIDYYEVTALIGKTMVEVREIARETEDTGHMQGACVPMRSHFIGEPKRYRVSPQGNSIAVHSFASAYLEVPTEVARGVSVFKPGHWTAYA